MILAFNAPHRFCIGSIAYPDQPISSQTAAIKKIIKKMGINKKGIYGVGSGNPMMSMVKYTKIMIIGIKSNAGKYQILCLLVLLKSKLLSSNCFTPFGLFSL